MQSHGGVQGQAGLGDIENVTGVRMGGDELEKEEGQRGSGCNPAEQKGSLGS